MSSKFDKVINRHGTGSVKWHHNDDTIPMWIADMDFKTAKPIRQSIRKVAKHDVLGYVNPKESVYKAVIEWHKRHYGLTLSAKDILFSTGVVTSIITMINVFTDTGDAVLVNEPVYAPFFEKVHQSKRQLITSSLVEKQQRYYFDFEDIENKIRENKVRLFILCNPHNPGGRVWTKKELQTLLNICMKYNVAIISDEIHKDLTLENYTFTPFLSLAKGYEHKVVSLTSITKTFNIAGIKCSMIFSKNEDLTNLIHKEQIKLNAHDVNIFAYAAIQSAYNKGETWLTEVKAYIRNNIDFSINFLEKNLPKIKIMKPEASYLIWFDCSSYCNDDQVIYEKLNEAKVQLVPGLSYGDSGTLKMRMNVACPRQTLIEGLYRIQSALTDI